MALAVGSANAQPARTDRGVIATKHNLSVSGPGTVKSQSETEVCVFCHVSHRGRGRGDNRPDPTGAYETYRSSTLQSPAPDAPSGATRTCLSCHDGTIALGQTVARSAAIQVSGAGAGGTIPPGKSRIGRDLRGSHPVSFVPQAPGKVHTPPAGDAVKLDRQGRVQCTSCHDPHLADLDPVQPKFLVKSNRASGLCVTCHAMTEWQANRSSHANSTALFDASRGATTPYTSVADNACESCHTPHAANTPARLLKSAGSDLCMPCHRGQVAKQDLGIELAQPFAHAVLQSDPNLHDPTEGGAGSPFTMGAGATGPRHVQCVDCHDPHGAFQLEAIAPNASGLLAGVWGIDRNGARVESVRFEYEVCFKCHADGQLPQSSGPTPPETLRRAVVDANLRRVFDLGAPSFHPVEGPGRNPDVPSLIAPLNAGTVIYCSDCHASDRSPGAGGSGPRGPHGSAYRHILERNLITLDMTPESPDAYALCYKCHDRAIVLDPMRSAFPRHAQHVVQQLTPCTVCHDSHGVSALQGNESNNAHLINFDVSVVKPGPRGVIEYVRLGPRAGTCTMRCHGTSHDGTGY